jgi:hypothetical protein
MWRGALLSAKGSATPKGRASLDAKYWAPGRTSHTLHKGNCKSSRLRFDGNRPSVKAEINVRARRSKRGNRRIQKRRQTPEASTSVSSDFPFPQISTYLYSTDNYRFQPTPKCGASRRTSHLFRTPVETQLDAPCRRQRVTFFVKVGIRSNVGKRIVQAVDFLNRGFTGG